ncbi:thermonuclease family protein [Pelagerythrobacter marensis]|uniref:TNase-like domain-containing protein n=1 Tax=Pelagerythrobacter marensis TaxID=543877 RepID=A0A0G3X4N7_9SPHN|nr:thermonuclease family protein [Pelagerythrobacter marensis]AKM06137.1 hypothetical protein AM2010_44 [Pelagerythrobacter marensis]
MSDPWPGRFVESPEPNWPGTVVSPTPTPSQTRKRRLFGAPPRTPAPLDNAAATDGDTIRAGDLRVRLLGVDAPELKQQGFDRQSNPVPIGEQSRDYLQGQISNTSTARLDDVISMSWGRPVGPVSLDGTDVGIGLIRSGNALAAPDYLESDPSRRFDYMQAERLARVNKLGPMNDTMAQNPADFRKGEAPRQTVAQFFDTPTPFQGMRPEAERQYLKLLDSAPAVDIATFAKSQGLSLDPDYLSSWVEDRDKRKARGLPYTVAARYSETPLATLELGDGAMGAGVRGYAEGFTASALGELGAVADTLGGTQGRENVWNSDRRLADIWANNEYQNASILRGDENAHPTASMVGQIGGALTSGFAIPYGQGARTVPQLARVGAVYGGAEGFMGTDGTVPQRLTGAAIGAPAGAIINAAGGKALEVVAPVIGRAVGAVRGRLGREASPSAIAAEDTTRGAIHAAQSDEARSGHVVNADAAALARSSGESPTVADADWPGEVVDLRAVTMDAEPDASLSMLVHPLEAARPTRLDDPLNDAQRVAAAANVQPRDVLPLPANTLGGVEEAIAKDAGRFVTVKAPNERAVLSRTTIKNHNGASVPKVGPMDMVGWLRTRGGLVDQGGELSAMGIRSNAARKGMDFVGQEVRFGPIVNENGLTLDDAAFQAWEAGFFPDHLERPDVNTFLNALRETYEGTRGRRFLPDDVPEVERYYGVQGERYDLEQRQEEVGGPVYDDAAALADEPLPFPPVEAYDDWAGVNAIQQVGNIDVTKLDSPQDISRALKATGDIMGGFDASTRGRITQAETGRLASDLNMTPEQLLSRRKGQAMNAEEALAARRILAKSGNELVNLAKRVKQAGDYPDGELLAQFRQALVRHSAIQEQVAGATAEAGRALGQFRMAADSREVRRDVLEAFVRGGGGQDQLEEAANVLLDAVEMGPGKFNAVAEKVAKPKWRDKIAEIYINFLLSWPQTHAVNITSNTLTSLAQIPEFAVGAAIGGVRRAVSSSAIDRVTASEVGARAFGLLQGAKEGARMFAKGLRTGEASDFASKVEGDQYRAVDGLKGEVLRLPTRFLTAEDEFFKGVARRMELNAQAVRLTNKEGLKGEAATRRIAELTANPTDVMLEKALHYGRYLTFQQKLGPLGSKISGITNDSLVLKAFLPFVRTPTNLLKFATERSPAAPLLKEWRADFAAGGARRDMAIARASIGTGFGIALYEAAQSGLITGSPPSDPKKSRLLYADGWKPYSIKLGDTYYSYKRLDPFSTTIGVAADMATLPEGMSERQREDKALLLTASIMGNLASKTWLSGLSDLVSALHEPDRYADNMMQRLVGSFLVPNLVAGTARTMDPVARETETLGEALQSRLPGLKDDLLPRRDVWGREIRSQGGMGPDWLSPVWVSEQLNDPVNSELLQLDYAPGYPSKKVGGRELTPEEYDRYSELAGKAAHEALGYLVVSSDWQSMDDAARVKAARKIVAAARRGVRSKLFNDSTAEADDWPGEPVDGDVWSGDVVEPAASAEQWPGKPVASRDVVTDLRQRIPGIRFTSGYRSPEYNDSLRAKGYNPARNSEHLSGAALDMLPPEGKSLGWLQAQVRQYDPNARLLVHDGHLHAGFDDYYNAPLLGGMAGR